MFRIEIKPKYPQDKTIRIGEIEILKDVSQLPKYTLTIHEGEEEIITFHADTWDLYDLEALQRLDRHLSFDAEDVLVLLQSLDGHLGLAVYRGEGQTEDWKTAAQIYITRIRKKIAEIEEML